MNKLLPRLVSLDSKRRNKIPKLGDKTYGVVFKGLEHAANNPEFVPRYMDIEEARRDFDALSTLRDFSTSLGSITKMLEDTIKLSGSEAYVGFLTFYRAVRDAGCAKQPGGEHIYNDLRSRFPGSQEKNTRCECIMILDSAR